MGLIFRRAAELLQWWIGERDALREAIHNNHTCFADGLDCCDASPEYEVCAAHSLLDDSRVVEAMAWMRRIYQLHIRMLGESHYRPIMTFGVGDVGGVVDEPVGTR